MWGIEAISYMNEKYVQERRAAPPPTPLDVLIARMLKPAPVSLSTLCGMMQRGDDYGEFIDMMDDLLPSHRQEIMREVTPKKQANAFLDFFEKEYFPLYKEWVLEDDDEDVIRTLVEHIPVHIMGVSCEEYDGFPENGDPDIILMTYLNADPWNGGERPVLAEAARRFIPREIVNRVPRQGFEHEELNKLVKGTKYEPLGLFANILCQDTGNYFFDTDDDTYCNGGWPLWDKPTVIHLKKKWKESEKWQKKIAKFREWLSLDLAGNFVELIEFLLKRREVLKIYGDDDNQGDGNTGHGADAGNDEAPVGTPGLPGNPA